MYRPRVIPCLTILNGDLVKTQRFKKPKYVGDPVNTVKIFNDLEVDELVILDIGATKSKREPNFDLLNDIASEAFMPLCYGGGVNCFAHAERIFHSGYEKIAVNTALHRNPDVVRRIAQAFGNQSVVGSIDVRDGLFKKNSVFNSQIKEPTPPIADFVRQIEGLGVGEILVQSVDRDGTMSGYNLQAIAEVSAAATVPVIGLGGAASMQDLKNGIEAGAAATAASSMFVFEGKHRAVLVSYPEADQLVELEIQ